MRCDSCQIICSLYILLESLLKLYGILLVQFAADKEHCQTECKLMDRGMSDGLMHYFYFHTPWFLNCILFSFRLNTLHFHLLHTIDDSHLFLQGYYSDGFRQQMCLLFCPCLPLPDAFPHVQWEMHCYCPW